ncbi:S-adenosyl-L-methionine-dependent methyltransferase [Xylona heveae TC161]|uniref:Trimethylguanosine synthase n=1 Tax=Xylona heveae (strain CBS 132557 / TC161) TaxID=1328760 RepID=A0A165GMG1_XYLHT|nr:S-adenosyl-L-methionine-dependent methyltransferase [Xylona heveae TC161]KZF22371.1 S-adenosyl-L-methionine-dependent methyltransferase [Xylona heveae TC161]
MNYDEPPSGCHHYTSLDEVPWEIQKYWQQRYNIFSKYDEGIWMTDDAWFGVTPEPVADKIANHITQSASKDKKTIIDCFAGAGGNAIAFAKSGRWDRIFAIEKDPYVLQCAKHNAEVYGVSNKIWWIEGDCFDIMKKRLATVGKDSVIFASPPWGGPGYSSDAIFCLSTMQPYSLNDLVVPMSKVTMDIVLYLPRTSDVRQLARYAPNGKKTPIIHYCMNGASKALCVYYGDFKFGIDHKSQENEGSYGSNRNQSIENGVNRNRGSFLCQSQ